MFKWIGGFLFGLVFLIALAIVVLPRVVDPNDYRQTITELVKEHTGRDLSLNGDLSVSIFPWLGIRTEKLSLSQPSEIGGAMIEVETAQLRVKLLPLLSKRVEIDTVVLEKPFVRLVTLANGIDSFLGLMGEANDDVQASESIDNSDQAGAALALLIQGLQLTDGRIDYDDRQSNQRYQINDLNLITGNLIGASLAGLEVSGVLIDSANPQPLHFDLDGQARIDVETLKLSLENMLIKVEQGDLHAKLTIDALTYDSHSTQIKVRGLKAQTAIANREFKLLSAEIDANVDSQKVLLADVKLTSGDLFARLTELQAHQFIDAPSVSGVVAIDDFNLLTLLKDMDIDFVPAGKSAFKQVGFQTDFKASLDRVSLPKLKLNLDSSHLTGAFSINNFDKPRLNFDLSLDGINLDDYVPKEDDVSQSSTESIGGAEALVVPMVLFKDVFANGRFRANRLVSGGVELKDIDVLVESMPGNVSIIPKASLYDGKLGGLIVYSEQGDQMQLHVKNSIDLVSLGKFLNAADVTDQLSGIGSLEIDIMVTERNGVQSNDGTIKLFAKDGALKGIDIKGMIDKGYAQYQKLKGDSVDQQSGATDSNDETRFAELIGTFNLHNFKLTNDDFELKAPLFRVAGSGEIDLANETIDYLINVSAVNSADGQGGDALDSLRGITLPIRLKGSLLAPSYSLDMKMLYKALAAKKIEQKKSDYLAEKLGIEDGGKLSTKDLLRQILSNKADKKIRGENHPEKVTQRTDEGAIAAAVQESPSVPAKAAQSDDIPDVDGQVAPAEDPSKKSTKKQLKEDLKNKLLDSIFN